MLHRMLAPLAVLVLTGCGKDGGATKTYAHDGSVKFSITVPSELEATPEKDEGGGWRNVILMSKQGHYSDVLINWQPTWSHDDLLTWFKAHQLELGPIKVIEETALPDGRGVYVHYESGVEYAKAVVRCGDIGVQCMATLAKDDPEPLKKQVIAACKTLVCK